MVVKIEVKGLSAWYGAKRAIQDITMDFADHEVTAIIGPSACGKSTLIRCLNRMHETIPKARAEGSVRLDGRDLMRRWRCGGQLRARNARGERCDLRWDRR